MTSPSCSDASAAAEGNAADVIDLAAERAKRARVVQSVPRQQKVAVGDKNRPVVATYSDDEISELGVQFNRMAAQLQDSFATLESERDALRTFIADHVQAFT